MHTDAAIAALGLRPVPMVVVFLVLLLVCEPVGLCIVFRRGRSAVPGCVPAWSADRAPPRP